MKLLLRLNNLRIFLTFLLIGGLRVAFTQEASLMRNQLQLESELNSQVRKELLQIFKKEEFIISSSIKLKSYRVTKVLEKESHINKKPQNEGKEQEILPGFYDSDLSSSSEVANEQIRRVYGHETKTDLEKAQLKVLVDESVTDARLEAAKKLLTQRLTNSFGGKIDIQFLPAVLKPKLAAVPFYQEFTGYLKDHMGLLLLFFCSLIFLFVLASLINRIRPKDQMPPVWSYNPPMSPPLDSLSGFGGPPPHPGGGQRPPIEVGPNALPLPSSQEKDLDELEVDKKINKFVSVICKEPFVTRKFFQTLDRDNQKSFMALFTSKSSKVALGEFFGEALMGPEAGDIASLDNEMDLEEKAEFLEFISLEHDRFKNLMAIKNGQRFSILSLMNDKELQYVFSNETPRDIAFLLHFLPRDSISGVLSRMDSEQKTKIILNLKKSSQLSSEAEREIEERLNKKINTFASSAFSTFMSEDSLVGSILDESDNAQEILDRISSTDKNLAKTFKSHSLNFDYFIENELDSLARIFETIPNETLALSLIEYSKDDRSRVLDALSPTRRKVIASSMLMNSKASHEEIRKAKLESSKLARKAYQLLQRNKMGKAS